MDRVKGVERLIAAYDDPEGVTAEFNLNLLRRINRELEADIPVEAFRHQACWNDMLGRIEMHLVATRDVEFTIEGKRFSFRTGQSIHTENSHKYGPRGARLLLLAGGWTPLAEWTEPTLCAAARAAKPAAMLYALFSIIDMILQVLVWIIIAQVIISWLVAFNVINTQSNFVRTLLDALDRMTAPLYRPIRKVLPDFGGIDFSPIVLILAIQILRKLNEGLALETSATVM
jgi:uncharacterized protein YggT (Ycf19 family)